MQYVITFLEGLISFISPCMLPMLPVYIAYFAGNADRKRRTFLMALLFVAGFSVIFCLLGLFSGTLGAALMRHATVVNIVCGAIVIVFGLSYLEVIRLPFFRGVQHEVKVRGLGSAFLFGVVYSVSLTPCIGAFLGSALMMASTAGTAAKGLLLLVCYSLGLGIPFLLASLLINYFAKGIAFIKRHYKVINTVCGLFLIAVGVLMMTGLLTRVLRFVAR